jgi:PIN domain nuclease of toxin-antitoxin system
MIETPVSYLLDTHVAIWLSSDIGRVPQAVLDILEDFETTVYLSTVCFWELAIKQGLGKIDADIRLDRIDERHGIRELTISSKYTATVKALPRLHGDPFDRMMVAQAMVERMVLVTSDRALAEYPVAVLHV